MSTFKESSGAAAGSSGASSSKRLKEAFPQNKDTNAVTDDNEKALADDDDGWSPSSLDKPSTFYKLSGYNEVPFVEVSGWTNTIVVGFPDLKPNLKMNVVDIPKGGQPPSNIEFLQELSEKLNVLARSACDEYICIRCPVFVKVIAKKKVDIVMMKADRRRDDGPHRALVIGNLVVADDTGACLLTTFNESNKIIHENVQVGDTLIINKASYKGTKKSAFKFDYPYRKFLLNFEIKISKYEVRHITHIPVQSKWPGWSYKLPSYLFDENDIRLKSSSQVWAEIGFLSNQKSDSSSTVSQPSTSEIQNNTDNSVGQSSSQIQKYKSYFDLQGIICYAGRIERVFFAKHEVDSILNPVKTVDENGMESVNGTEGTIISKQFVAYRWIKVVDKTSKPLPVKIFLNKDNLKDQAQLIPGTIVLITNCHIETSTWLETFVSSTVCSKIYCNDDLTTYFNIMPHSYLKSISSNIDFNECQEIFRRSDVDWSAGGTIQLMIKSPKEFLNHYKEEGKGENASKKQIMKCIPQDWVFEDRESMIIYFRGRIYSVQEVTNESSATHHGRFFCHKEVYPSGRCTKLPGKDGWPKKGVTFSNASCFCEKCEAKNWIFSKRKMPAFEMPESTTSRELSSKLRKIPYELCQPLLMPSVYPEENNEVKIPPLGKCERLEKLPFYRVIIRDEEQDFLYSYYGTVWNSSPFETMKAKWESARGKMIVGLIDIHVSRPGSYGMEVSLRDFVVEEQCFSND